MINLNKNSDAHLSVPFVKRQYKIQLKACPKNLMHPIILVNYHFHLIFSRECFGKDKHIKGPPSARGMHGLLYLLSLYFILYIYIYYIVYLYISQVCQLWPKDPFTIHTQAHVISEQKQHTAETLSNACSSNGRLFLHGSWR